MRSPLAPLLLAVPLAILGCNGSSSGVPPNDGLGTFAWAAAFGGPGADTASKVATDAAGNSYTAGSFSGTVDFNPGAGVENRTSVGETDAYLLCLSPTGAFLWVATWGGAEGDLANGLAVDDAGNSYTVGHFRATVDFDPGAAVENQTSAGANDAFLLALDPDGDFRWAATWGGSGGDGAYGVAVDADGATAITGSFFATADFDPGAGTIEATSAGEADAYLLTLASDGTFLDVATWGGTSFEFSWGIAHDSDGNFLITGAFMGAADFDPGSGDSSHGSNGDTDAYLLGLDPNGDFLWVKTWGGLFSDYAYTVALDASDNCYVTGYFAGTVDFDPDAATVERASAGEDDAYLISFDPAIAMRWVTTWGGTGDDNAFDVAVDGAGNSRVVGDFRGTVDFDAGADTAMLTSAGGSDAFLLLLTPSGAFGAVGRLGGPASDHAASVARSTGGDSVVAGDFGATADLNPGGGIASRTSSGEGDAFTLRLGAPSG